MTKPFFFRKVCKCVKNKQKKAHVQIFTHPQYFIKSYFASIKALMLLTMMVQLGTPILGQWALLSWCSAAGAVWRNTCNTSFVQRS